MSNEIFYRPEMVLADKAEPNDKSLSESVEVRVQEACNLKNLSSLFSSADKNGDGNLTKAELKKVKTEDSEEVATVKYVLENFDDIANGDSDNKTISRQDIDSRSREVTVDALKAIAKNPEGISGLDNGDLYALGAGIPRGEAAADEFVEELNKQLKAEGVTNAYYEMERDVDIQASIGGGTDNILYLVINGEKQIVARQSASRARC